MATQTITVGDQSSECEVFGVGTSALIDSFGGMVPCKVLRVLKPCNGIRIGRDEIEVEVLRTMAGYRKGERLLRSAAYTPPRKCRVKRTYDYRIRTNYVYN